MLNRLFSAQSSLFCIGLLFCLPYLVAYHHVPIPAFYAEWLAGLLGLLALPVLFFQGRWHAPALPQISLVFLGLLALLNLQLLLGMIQANAQAWLIQLYLLWGFLLVVLGAHLRRTLGWETLCTTLAWALLLGATVNAGFVVLQLAQKMGMHPPIPQLQSYGMLAQSNAFADYISLGICSLLLLFAKQKIANKPLFAGILIGLCLLAFSGSRSVVLYLLLMTGLGLLLALKRNFPATASYLKPTLLRTSLALIPLFFILQWLLAQALPNTWVDFPSERAWSAMQASTASPRLQFWRTCWYLFSQSPWLGVGAGQMRWQTYLLINHVSANPAQIFFEHAHNLFFHLLAEMGLFAAGLTLTGLALWAWRAIKSVLDKQTFTAESAWLLAVIAIISTHSMLEYPLWYAQFLGIYAFLLGVGEQKYLSIKLSFAAQRLLKGLLPVLILYGLYELGLMHVAYQTLAQQISVANQAEMSDEEKKRMVEEMLWVEEHTLLAPYAQLLLATYVSPEPDKTTITVQTDTAQTDTAQTEALLALTSSALQFMPLKLPRIHHVILLEMHHQHSEALQHLQRLLILAGGNLQDEIAQLPEQQQWLLQKLLMEIDTEKAKTNH